MPLQIVRQDITKIECDAIVNPSNRHLIPGGGIDATIHKMAGPELLQLCSKLGGVEIGETKITPAFNLPCKYVIHTAGPVWKGGQNNEQKLLENCYRNSLKTALENGCESIAIPLISTGAYNYPKDKVLRVAIDTISNFLFDYELTVYIVVFDKKSYSFSEKLFGKVAEFIDDNYVDDKLERRLFNIRSVGFREYELEEDCYEASLAPIKSCKESAPSLEDMLSAIDDTFAVTLMRLIDIKGMTDVQCYKKANVSKQTWYKILNDKNYKPSKNTVIAFAISLELSLSETQHLLATVGFALSKSSKFDIIIEYFITNGIYDIFEINETLFEFDQVCLGV